jgi:hypothetical protein
MRVIAPVPEEQVVAAFLRAEINSPRFGPGLLALLGGEDVSIVTEPRLDDARENDFRAQLLDRHRGWLKREGLFSGLPEHINWSRAELTREELLEILYINWDWWLTITGGTRRPREAARRIRAGEIAGVNLEGHAPIAGTTTPELIAVAPLDYTRVVLIEGHVRLTAYALFPEEVPDTVEIYLGASEEIHRWRLF